mmetsp:Transcript_26109/g.42783  ORF Transcript_26109/g.42783 Transcript_26109/m.42783 type:complete len:204 (+) Transcript_26109:295-906(+)
MEADHYGRRGGMVGDTEGDVFRRVDLELKQLSSRFDAPYSYGTVLTNCTEFGSARVCCHAQHHVVVGTEACLVLVGGKVKYSDRAAFGPDGNFHTIVTQRHCRHFAFMLSLEKAVSEIQGEESERSIIGPDDAETLCHRQTLQRPMGNLKHTLQGSLPVVYLINSAVIIRDEHTFSGDAQGAKAAFKSDVLKYIARTVCTQGH